MDKLPFLKSQRFWSLVVLAIAVLLKDYGVLPAEVTNLIVTVAGGNIGIRSLDSFAERIKGKKL